MPLDPTQCSLQLLPAVLQHSEQVSSAESLGLSVTGDVGTFQAKSQYRLLVRLGINKLTQHLNDACRFNL